MKNFVAKNAWKFNRAKVVPSKKLYSRKKVKHDY